MKTKIAVLFVLIIGVTIQSQANIADIPAFLHDFYAAYKAKDAVRLAQFYAADATFVDPSFKLDLKGPDQIRELLTKALAKYESLDFQIAHTTSSGDNLVVEGSMMGQLAAKMVRVPFVSSFHFRGEKIAEQRDMFDVTHFLVQLGLVPPPFGSETPSSLAADQKGASEPALAAESRALFETIEQMDTKMFNALNAHDVEALMTTFTDDLEFYQDNDGLKNYQQCFTDFKKMFANNPGIRRDLVKGSLEVYPIKDYGAIEIGMHRFCHKENGKDDCGSFKFLMVWRKTGDAWKVSRVISYGH